MCRHISQGQTPKVDSNQFRNLKEPGGIIKIFKVSGSPSQQANWIMRTRQRIRSTLTIQLEIWGAVLRSLLIVLIGISNRCKEVIKIRVRHVVIKLALYFEWMNELYVDKLISEWILIRWMKIKIEKSKWK